METIILILKIIGIGWFLTNIKEIMDILFNIIFKPKNIFKLPLIIFSCLKCSTFWVSLIMTFDFGLSCLLSLIIDQIDKRNIITKDITIK